MSTSKDGNRNRMRGLVTLAVGALMFVLTIGSSGAVGAATPTNVFTANGCPVGNYRCLGYGDPMYYGAVPYGGVPFVYAHYNAIPGAISYFDPRYCGDGRVSIVADKDGNRINVCTTTGVRVYPVYADGYPYIIYR